MYARDYASIATPIGAATVIAEGGAITSVRIGDAPPESRSSEIVREALDQLEAWFAGERRDFLLPLAQSRTARGAALRAGLMAVQYGECMSYGALARQLGSSARAIGQLCARNPIPIIVPCHRILGGGGAFGAFSAGSGPTTKAWLLAHEQRHRPFELTG